MCDIALADGLLTRFEITFANDEVDGVTALMQAEGAVMGLPTPAPTSVRSAMR